MAWILEFDVATAKERTTLDPSAGKLNVAIGPGLDPMPQPQEVAVGFQLKRWDVVVNLQGKDEQAHYLQACFEEDPGDGSLIRVALGDIARAGGMAHFATDIGLSQECLCQAFAPGNDPALSIVLKVLHSLGLRLHTVPV